MAKNVWYICKYADVAKYSFDSRQSFLCKEFVKKGLHATLILANYSHFSQGQPIFKGDFKKEIIDGVQVIWINIPNYGKATSIKRFWSWIVFEYRIITNHRKIAIENRPDVVIASSLSLLSVISGFFLKRKYKAKFIFEIRDIWPMAFQSTVGWSDYNPIIWLLRMFEKFAYKHADQVVGTMPALNIHVKESIGKEVPCACIPQGISLDFYQNRQELLEPEFLNRYLPQNKFTITYAGTLGCSYALDKVVDAAKILFEKNPNVQFIFLGDGVLKPELMKQAEGYNNVIFVPKIPKTKVSDFLAHSSVLLCSIEMQKENNYGISPNKYIDYMYSARPVIVMFSGYRSIINDAKCGYFVPSADSVALAEKIEEMYHMEKSELDNMGLRGKQYLLDHCRYEILAEQYIELM